MIILSLIFLAIFFLEWSYLKHKNRKKRTHWIVFSFMGVAYIYCSVTILFPDLPSPNNLIQFVFKPLQQKILW